MVKFMCMWTECHRANGKDAGQLMFKPVLLIQAYVQKLISDTSQCDEIIAASHPTIGQGERPRTAVLPVCTAKNHRSQYIWPIGGCFWASRTALVAYWSQWLEELFK